jgi:hypothetical protein
MLDLALTHVRGTHLQQIVQERNAPPRKKLGGGEEMGVQLPLKPGCIFHVNLKSDRNIDISKPDDP